MRASRPRNDRHAWVSYLRVSTPEQAEKDLSLPAQRHSIDAYAERHRQVIAREYVEAGCSGTTMNRKAFRVMLQDVLREGSDIGAILVHHTSRFSRDATEARVLKKALRKKGVRVISVCQETKDDPFGNLIEGLFECIDQYESEIIGARSSEAMREAARQGYYPGSKAPYGFTKARVEAGRGVFRNVLVPDDDEAPVVRLLFQLYVALRGALAVAIELNGRGVRYRKGRLWTKELVLDILDEPAVAGTCYWQKRDPNTGRRRDPSECLALPVEPIVDLDMYELARRLRAQRNLNRRPGRAASSETVLSRLVRCAKCGGSYRLESSGKGAGTGDYRYRYYNCRTRTRIGSEACRGHRIRTEVLDAAVLEYVAGVVCTAMRAEALLAELKRRSSTTTRPPGQQSYLQDALAEVRGRIDDWGAVAKHSRHHRELAERRAKEMRRRVKELQVQMKAAVRETLGAGDLDEITVPQLRDAWTNVILAGGVVSRTYLHRLVDRIEVDENRITVVPKDFGAATAETQ